MANLYYAAGYKSMIINLLAESSDFITLLNSKAGEHAEPDGHIFDYDFADRRTSDEKTFVVVETDIPSIRQNTFTDFNLYIYIFTAKSLVRISENTVPDVETVRAMGYFTDGSANRIDVLCDIADRILNGTDRIEGIGSIKPAAENHVTVYAPNHRYYGKCLKYQISNLN